MIADADHEGRAQFKITTERATYYFDKAGGGFSRLLDREGRDWIAFKKDPLNVVPASSAAGFRGVPNMHHGAGHPDAGASHPGFDKCESTVAAPDTIRTVTKSGLWAWSWRFTESAATLTIEKADGDRAYWFLYEGPVGGRWSPRTHYWGASDGGPRRDTPDSTSQLFGSWRWAYFGDDAAPRVLVAAQHRADEAADTLWYMGNTAARLDAPDGMIVFGFGRGKGGTKHLAGVGHRFTLGFVEEAVKDAAAHARVAATVAQFLAASPPFSP